MKNITLLERQTYEKNYKYLSFSLTPRSVEKSSSSDQEWRSSKSFQKEKVLNCVLNAAQSVVYSTTVFVLYHLKREHNTDYLQRKSAYSCPVLLEIPWWIVVDGVLAGSRIQFQHQCRTQLGGPNLDFLWKSSFQELQGCPMNTACQGHVLESKRSSPQKTISYIHNK